MANQRKTHVLRAAQPGAQFIQLEVRKLEVGEAAPMQDLRVLESRGTERLVMVVCR
jgi:hypothetical protein